VSVKTFGFYLVPFAVSVPFLFFPVWWAISRGLRPLNRVAAEVVARTDTDLSNISNTPYRELSPIVSAINRLMEKVNTRIQREQEFLHDAAHELKTPLAVIQLNSEILASTTDELTKKIALTGIQKGVTRATRTTHQLLASARAENHLYNRAASVVINFTQLLQDRLAYWMSFALLKNIEIELDAPSICELKVDVESISLLVDNLIDNAIKYSDSMSTIRVRLMNESARIKLQISDRGRGIPEEYREKVFERFYRINQSETHGTGLGLSIVKRAAQQHAATVELASNLEAGHGLVVTINFERNW
jgi:two-component system sensor histidine kinase QseC